MKSMKLSTKLIIGGLIISLIPLMILGIFTVITASGVLDNLEKEQLVNLKQTVIALINTKLNEQVKLLVNASTNDATIAEITRSLDATGVSEMVQFRLDMSSTIYHDKNTYELFYITDKKGIIVGNTSGGIHSKKDISETDYFKSAIRGDTVIGKVVRSEKTGLPYIIGAGPMKTTKNDIIGVIVIGWKMDELNKKISELNFGITGYAFIADKDGLIISHPHKQWIMNLNIKDSDQISCAGMQMIALKDGIEECGHKGDEKLIAFGPIETGKWSLGLVIHKSEYMLPIINMRYIIIVFSIATAVIVMLEIFLFIRRSITLPVASLINSVRTIAEGNYNIPVTWNEHDEIGMLVSDVDRMRLAIKDLTESIEQEVIERTSELSEALEHLRKTQNQLIQTEKIAALGQLIAGVAHEINTPLGAIRASVDNISDSLSEIPEQLPRLSRLLSEDQQKYFSALISRSLENRSILSAREERKIKRKMIGILEEHKTDNADSAADTLTDMGVYDNIDIFLPLLLHAESDFILKTAYNLSGLQKSTQNISVAADRASKVVFALKSYARFDSSGEKVKADLTEGIETVLTLYQNKLKHGVEVIRYYEELPPVPCYPDELNQVWTNLIHNAIQAMDGKGILEIGVCLKDNHAAIIFTDIGKGIPEEIADRIFEPFFTTKPLGEGSGLGLSIVKKIIDKHDGKIEVESRPGRTSFCVMIPIVYVKQKGN